VREPLRSPLVPPFSTSAGVLVTLNPIAALWSARTKHTLIGYGMGVC
jgi:hypothetical protein